MFNLNGKISSLTEGRLRIKTPLLKTADKTSLIQSLKKVNGVESLKLNQTTGSLLVTFDPKKLNTAEFEKTFDECLKIREQTVSEEVLEVADERESKRRKLDLYRSFRKIENQTMAAAGTLCLLGVGFKLWRLHSWAGWIFSAAAVAHSIRYKKQLLR